MIMTFVGEEHSASQAVASANELYDAWWRRQYGEVKIVHMHTNLTIASTPTEPDPWYTFVITVIVARPEDG